MNMCEEKHWFEEISKQAIEESLSLESISDYLKSHRLGFMPPHGGFAIGIAHVISRLLGITVKQSTTFQRDPERVTP